MILETDDIQGNVVHGYRFPKVAHLFTSITPQNRAACRRWLRGLQVTPATSWADTPPAHTLNVGLSYAAVAVLRPETAPAISNVFVAFAQGMSARAAVLGDPRVETWSGRDVWVCLHAADDDALQAAVNAQTTHAGAHGIGLSTPLHGAALVEGDHWYEHFGFRDDISNPVVEGTEHLSARTGERVLAGNGKKDEDGKWVPLAPGEFVLGYPNESKEIMPPAALLPLFKNGTFAVFRQYQQHVERFHTYLAVTAENQRIDRELLAAKMLGRFRNGQPLANTLQDLNDFDFAQDRDGARCPFGAHIRRANHRDPNPALGGRHRMIRRGIPYGPRLAPKLNGDPHTPPDGIERGLFFVGLNANIEEQFEFIQDRWFNRRASESIDDRDPLVGSPVHKRTLKVEGHTPPLTLFDIPRFVTFCGGEYYFMPGLAALERLVADT